MSLQISLCRISCNAKQSANKEQRNYFEQQLARLHGETVRACSRMFGFGLYRILPFFLTGAVAAVVTTPFDVAKTRVMLAKVQSPLDMLCFEL